VPDILVANASPLIFLGNAGRLDLLRLVGASRILVPEGVYREVVASAHRDRACTALTSTDWIERVGPTPVPTGVVEWDLDPGEAEVVALALATNGAAALIDDLAGRKCALALGLRVLGTLGVVVAAHRRGHVPEPRRLLLELRSAGMWLSDRVIDRALALAGIEP